MFFFRVELFLMLCVCCILSTCYCQDHQRHVDEEWEKFKTKYNRIYQGNEEIRSKSIFESNLKDIEKHNDLYEQGEVSFKKAMNKYGDISEFQKSFEIPKDVSISRKYLLEDCRAIIEAENDVLKAWQDTIEAENDVLKAWQDTIETENDVLKAWQDTIEAANDVLKARQDTIEAADDVLKARQDTIEAAKDVLKARQDTIEAANDVLKARQDTIEAAYDVLKARQDTIEAANDVLKARQDTIEAANDVIKARQDTIEAVNDVLKARQDTIEAANDVLEARQDTIEAKLDVEVSRYLSKRSLNNKITYLPSHVDWRDESAVTSVKDQGQCSSCYAFSATGAIESQYYLKTKQLISLSEQHIIDCSSSYHNKGCEGGLPHYAFQYLMENKNQTCLQSEDHYKYVGRRNNQTCNERHSKCGPVVKGYAILPICEKALKYIVAIHGPVSVVVQLNKDFVFYSKGLFYSNNTCDDWSFSHAMLVVGYGTSHTTSDYWIVKNSWGTDWGDNGYVKMARNRGNHRGIVRWASIVYLE